MINEFVKAWDKNKGSLKNFLALQDQDDFSYKFLVEAVIREVINHGEITLDESALTEIDNGDYQGTLLFVVPVDTYQPSVDQYYYTNVYYGSCSGCDTLQGIHNYDNGKPDEDQLKDYMSLCLHILQKFKKMGE